MVINVENSPTKVQCLNFDSLAMTTRAMLLYLSGQKKNGANETKALLVPV